MTVGGEAYAVDAELAMKGNIKTADVVTVSVKAPRPRRVRAQSHVQHRAERFVSGAGRRRRRR